MARRREKEKPPEKGTSVKRLKKRIVEVATHSDYISSLFYGRSGTGKTTLAASMVEILDGERNRVLLLDLRERGTDSVSDVENLDRLDVMKWEDFEGVYWMLKEEEHPWGGVIVDTSTRLQELSMVGAREAVGVASDGLMTRLAWNKLGGMLGPRLLDLRDLEMHTCFLAQDRRDDTDEDEDDEGDLLPEFGPALMPSVARNLNAMVSVIGQTHVKQKVVRKGKKVKRRTSFHLRVGPHPLYLTKVRSPKGFVVPDSIINPSFVKIQKLMRGETLGKAKKEK